MAARKATRKRTTTRTTPPGWTRWTRYFWRGVASILVLSIVALVAVGVLARLYQHKHSEQHQTRIARYEARLNARIEEQRRQRAALRDKKKTLEQLVRACRAVQHNPDLTPDEKLLQVKLLQDDWETARDHDR